MLRACAMTACFVESGPAAAAPAMGLPAVIDKVAVLAGVAASMGGVVGVFVPIVVVVLVVVAFSDPAVGIGAVASGDIEDVAVVG